MRIIKCPKCGVFNKNEEYCTDCGIVLSEQKKRELKEQAYKKEEIEKVIYKKENPNFAERLKKHPNFFYRILGWILYSAFMMASIIGTGLAWLIAMIAAG